MEYLLVKYGELIPTYSDDDYSESLETLRSHMKNKEYYIHNRQTIYRNTTIEVDYSTKNLNQASFIGCTFNKSNFAYSSFVGSRFINCKFICCDLTGTNFRSSYFENVVFYSNNVFMSTNLSKCQLINCSWDECDFDCVALDEATFMNCTFANAAWNALSCNLCTFKKTSFKKILLKNMNLEFSVFSEIHMHNMKIPFPTIPYIYGGFKYLCSTNDNVRITSQHDKTKGISIAEYLSLIDQLEIYYTYNCYYFPLANIYLAKGIPDKCKSALLMGIKKAILTNDMFTLKNLVFFINLNSIFSAKESNDIFAMIVSQSNQTLNNHSNYTNKCIIDIRNMLLRPVGLKSSVHISIKTSINDDVNKLSKLIGILEKEFHNYCEHEHDIDFEIRHNSPYELFINLFSDYNSICVCLGIAALIIKGSDAILTKILTHIQSIQQIKRQSLENQKLELELESQKNDNSSKYKATQAVHNAKDAHRVILENNITILSFNYIIVTAEENIIVSSDSL